MTESPLTTDVSIRDESIKLGQFLASLAGAKTGPFRARIPPAPPAGASGAR